MGKDAQTVLIRYKKIGIGKDGFTPVVVGEYREEPPSEKKTRPHTSTDTVRTHETRGKKDLKTSKDEIG